MKYSLIFMLLAVFAFACESDDCCKVCKDSIACGDSCIPSTSTCTQPAGCACNG